MVWTPGLQNIYILRVKGVQVSRHSHHGCICLHTLVSTRIPYFLCILDKRVYRWYVQYMCHLQHHMIVCRPKKPLLDIPSLAPHKATRPGWELLRIHTQKQVPMPFKRQKKPDGRVLPILRLKLHWQKQKRCSKSQGTFSSLTTHDTAHYWLLVTKPVVPHKAPEVSHLYIYKPKEKCVYKHCLWLVEEFPLDVHLPFDFARSPFLLLTRTTTLHSTTLYYKTLLRTTKYCKALQSTTRYYTVLRKTT